MTTQLVPVILAGGSGTRLWPLSRKNFPKQFLCLQGDSSLLQQTMQRTQSLACKQTLIVSNQAHYFLCQEQLQAFSESITYLLEPCARNTAPAIAAAAHHLANTVGRDAVMLILPSDHWIPDMQAWHAAMMEGVAAAIQSPVIVTFGIKPTQAKTGYGYIGAGPVLHDKVLQISAFREKPDVKTAEMLVSSGCYFWNSGMFVCRVGTYLDELARLASDIHQNSAEALNQAIYAHDYIHLDMNAFEKCSEASIDYAIMEKTTQGALLPINIPWSDLGCWTSVAEANALDANGNALHGQVLAKDTHNCLISSEKTLVTTLGLQDQIIVVTQDAVLVANKQYSQQVKDIVGALGSQYSNLAQDHQWVSRPWGSYEILAEGATFKVKRLMVKPGARLSLQMHQYRSEHWVVVSGEAVVINDDQEMKLCVNQSTYIPAKTKHRLSNMQAEPLFLIEVQSGSYLGEDDITRFDDVYRRQTEQAVL